MLSLSITREQGSNLDNYRLGLDFSEDGKTLAVPLSGSQLQLWNVVTRKPGMTLTLSDPYSYARALSPQGNTLASASNNQVTLWDTRNGKKLRAITVASLNPVTALDFSSDGKLLAVATWKGVQLHDARSLALLKSQSISGGMHTTIGSVAFTPDSKTVLFVTVHAPTLYRWRFK
jgi:WD40 repeat protein